MKSNFIGLNDRQLYLFLSTEVNFVCWELSLRLRTTKGWVVYTITYQVSYQRYETDKAQMFDMFSYHIICEVKSLNCFNFQ